VVQRDWLPSRNAVLQLESPNSHLAKFTVSPSCSGFFAPATCAANADYVEKEQSNDCSDTDVSW
jgi:hypothetical protein